MLAMYEVWEVVWEEGENSPSSHTLRSGDLSRNQAKLVYYELMEREEAQEAEAERQGMPSQTIYRFEIRQNGNTIDAPPKRR